MEDRGAGFVPSQARTCERKVAAPQRSPSAPRTLATALIFHMISLPPVLRLALALQAGCIAAPFSAGKTCTETCFITAALRCPTASETMRRVERFARLKTWLSPEQEATLRRRRSPDNPARPPWTQRLSLISSAVNTSVVLRGIGGRHCLLQNKRPLKRLSRSED